MKKIMTIVLALMILLTMVACGNAKEGEPTETGVTTTGTETAPPDTSKETEPTVPALTEPAEDDDHEISAVVKQLFEEFDTALKDQIGTMPEDFADLKVGAVIISLTNPFWSNMKDLYEEAAEDYGIELDVQTGTTEGDTASQLDVLMTMADMDYDVIIVSPIDGSNLIPGIKKCNENGVKVINLGPGVDLEALEEAGAYLDAKITVKFEDQGEIVAKDMMARLPEGGEVAVLAGLAGAAQSEGRSKGFIDTIATDDSITLSNTINCDWDASLAYDATKDLLLANPELKGIFACNDIMALAAVEALEAAGVSDVYVYGVDFTDEARASIKEAGMTGSMSYSSKKYTAAALQMAVMLNEGQEIAGPVYLPLTLANAENNNDLDGWR